MQTIIQYIAIICFVVLGIIDIRACNYDFAGLNFSIAFLYLFLYIQPFVKLLGR